MNRSRPPTCWQEWEGKARTGQQNEAKSGGGGRLILPDSTMKPCAVSDEGLEGLVQPGLAQVCSVVC